MDLPVTIKEFAEDASHQVGRQDILGEFFRTSGGVAGGDENGADEDRTWCRWFVEASIAPHTDRRHGRAVTPELALDDRVRTEVVRVVDNNAACEEWVVRNRNSVEDTEDWVRGRDRGGTHRRSW